MPTEKQIGPSECEAAWDSVKIVVEILPRPKLLHFFPNNNNQISHLKGQLSLEPIPFSPILLYFLLLINQAPILLNDSYGQLLHVHCINETEEGVQYSFTSNCEKFR